MNNHIYNKLKTQWDIAKVQIEIADTAFIVLRSIVFAGGVGWLLFSDISKGPVWDLGGLFVYFSVYSLVVYFWLFVFPQRKRIIYLLSLCFDFSFISLLVNLTGGFDSEFFNAFYLMTALYAFYYGHIIGTGVAAVSAVLYFLSSGARLTEFQWNDFYIKAAVLFLIAVPIGMLSNRLKKDTGRIENLNKDLQKSIDALRNLQGRVVQAEKFAAIGRVTADIAHDIRNPLTSIGGFARRLNKKFPAGTKEKGYTDLMISEVDRLERILKDVLMFSREARFSLQYFNINEVIREALNAFSSMLDEQSIQVKENLDLSLPPVLIDKDQAVQTVNNIIGNAIDAMHQGGTLGVSTFMRRMYDADYVVVEIADTGYGIPDDKLDIIFEPFFTTKKIGTGTGLGLSICKKIMDEHNGLVMVESTQGQGAVFRLFFPYQSQAEAVKTMCWEFQKCGVEKTEGAAVMKCAAYPNYGRMCWVVAGTFCGKKVSGAIAQKLGDCKKCEFYQRIVVRKDI